MIAAYLKAIPEDTLVDFDMRCLYSFTLFLFFIFSLLVSSYYLPSSDIIAGRPEEEALAVMKCICDSVNPNSLNSVNVSDNAIGFKGVASIEKLLTGQRLEKLFLCNNGSLSSFCLFSSPLSYFISLCFV